MTQTIVFRDMNHHGLTIQMNNWLANKSVKVVALSVEKYEAYFHAFLVYETTK